MLEIFQPWRNELNKASFQILTNDYKIEDLYNQLKDLRLNINEIDKTYLIEGNYC